MPRAMPMRICRMMWSPSRAHTYFPFLSVSNKSSRCDGRPRSRLSGYVGADNLTVVPHSRDRKVQEVSVGALGGRARGYRSLATRTTTPLMYDYMYCIQRQGQSES